VPKPCRFYAGQAKPNILERIFYLVNRFWKIFPQKYCTFLIEPLKWTGMQPLLGKIYQNMTAVDSPCTRASGHLICKWGFGGIHPKRSLPSCSSLDTQQPKLEVHYKKNPTKTPSSCIPASFKTNKQSVALSNSISA